MQGVSFAVTGTFDDDIINLPFLSASPGRGIRFDEETWGFIIRRMYEQDASVDMEIDMDTITIHNCICVGERQSYEIAKTVQEVEDFCRKKNGKRSFVLLR